MVTVNPKDNILDSIRKLEINRISAMPVVDEDRAVSVIISDIFDRHTLLRLLQSDI